MRAKRRFVITVISVFMVFWCGMCLAQIKEAGEPTDGKLRLQWFDRHVEMVENSLFKNYSWRFIGPQWMSGRIVDIDVPRSEPFTVYVATASGGLWRTDNEGTTWESLFDGQSATSIADIAIAPSNPDIIWVGTGENNSSRSTYSGTGVFKSVDGGKTFTHMGLEDSHHIGRIVIHPSNPDIVYIASIGSLYSYNRERGVYKTVDGGRTWEEVLFVNKQTGFIDLAMDPSNPNTLYAAAWDRLRRGWEMWEYGPGSGIYKSTDGGKNWKKLTNGFPTTGKEGRIGLAVSPANPNVVYASIDNHDVHRKAQPGELDPYGFPTQDIIKAFEVFRSDDKGETWRKANVDHLPAVYRTFGYYFGQIRVNPQNENDVWALGVPMMKSSDGGRTWNEVPSKGVHSDYQSMWVDPDNPDRLIIGNDGGLNISYDGGENWKDIKNLPVVQFYFVNVDMAKPFNIYGTAQDHGCFMGPVTHDPENDNMFDWKSIPGGEASYLAVDPTKPEVLFHEGYYGDLERSNLLTGESKNIKPQVEEGEPALRCTWLTPFIISPHNPFTIYWGSQYVHRSVNRGDSWQVISPDLTDNDEKRRGDVPFGTITTISESPVIPGIIWAGTDDGNVHLTRDGGTTWTKIKDIEDKWVSRVEASHFWKCTAYISLNGYRDDDFNVYLYRVSLFGKKVEKLGDGIPGGPINVIKEDPVNSNVLYVGTDTGVYVSMDRGATWEALMADMPVTFVHDVVVHPRDNILVAGTHGRGIYVMDVAPLQQYTDEVKEESLHVFDCRPVKRPRGYRGGAQAEVPFVLKSAGRVTVEITGEDGKTVARREMSGERGFNKFMWDLRIDGSGERRPFASIGSYKVRVSTGYNFGETVLVVK